MKEDLEQLLKNLHLGRVAEILDQELGEAAQARRHKWVSLDWRPRSWPRSGPVGL